MNTLLFRFYQQDTGNDNISLFESILISVKNVIPKVMFALVILFFGWLIAKLVQWIVLRLMQQLQVNKFMDKFNAWDVFEGRAVAVNLTKLLSKLVFYVIIWLAIIAAVDFLGVDVLSNLIVEGISYLPNLFAAIVVLLAGVWLAAMLKNAISKLASSVGMTSYKVMSELIFYFVVINIVLVSLSQAGIDTELITNNISIILIGLVSAFALGYGISARETITNYLSSLYAKDKFFIGSVIRVGDIQGLIIHKDATSVTLETSESHKVVIPMSQMSQNAVEIIEERLLDDDFLNKINDLDPDS